MSGEFTFDRFEFQQPLYGGVNVLRIGDTLLDTGHVAPRSQDAVREALDDPDRLGGVERVVITHPHVDHIGGSETIAELADLPHLAFEGVPDIVHGFADYLQEARADMTRLLSGLGAEEEQWNVYFPVQEYHEDRIRFERVFDDGETVRLGPYDCEVIHTPGHSAQHVAFWHAESGTLLSADLVSENGHFMYAPLYCDIGDYKQSLRRVRELDPDRLVPMHGPPMDDPAERIDDCLAKAESTEARILDWLDERGPFLASEFAREELGASGATTGFLSMVVYEYAAHLDERGDCSVAVEDDGIHVRP
jgi:glyoxylase-like metal-dependent hydrolase (beta-lactamase superfamily II)